MKYFLISLVFLIGAIKPVYAGETNFLIINQIRGDEDCCDKGSGELIDNINRIENIKSLPMGWTIRYDVFDDPVIFDKIKKINDLGLLLEITPRLATESKVIYKGSLNSQSSDWFFAKNSMLLGYSQESRKKLIDTVFGKFKAKLGYFPSYTSAWMIDGWSLKYIHDRYGVILHELTKEQYETDSYSLEGGIFNAPYYPSSSHPLIPGNFGNKLGVVMVRQTISDLLYNYGSPKSFYTSQPNDYLENPQIMDTTYFKSLVDDAMNQPSEFRFGVLGFENSYPWDKYGQEYLRQLEYLAELDKSGRLKIISPSDYAKTFQNKYTENPSFFLEKDFNYKSKIGVLWYFGKNYRVRILLKNQKLIMDDLRVFTPINDPYYQESAVADYSYWTVPYLIDGSKMFLNSQKTNFKNTKNFISENKQDTITSPFGIELGEEDFDLINNTNEIEIKFKDNQNRSVILQPQKIILSKNLQAKFTYPKDMVLNNLFSLDTPQVISFPNQFNLFFKPEKKAILAGWNVGEEFIPFFTFTRDENSITLTPVDKITDLQKLNPMFQPDKSDLKVDPDHSIFYWNNKTAVAGRNPLRLFILPLNSLGRPTSVQNIQVTSDHNSDLRVQLPPDYTYRLKPWFIDITSNIPLSTTISITSDGIEIAKNIPIQFITDCKKEIKKCLTSPTQLFAYIYINAGEQWTKVKRLVLTLKV
ncbi:hypothetical protein HY338_01165 [Candidatus Gottesmanbacteria bacterium]|nr:hypothetical protein [Candidatus Gottesmanbacteria bacterium]